jgi:limonene-1,2-epoxide hydrolase
MGKQQEDFVIEFIRAWDDGTENSRPDKEKILSMMTEDAEWQLWVPGGPVIKGQEALRAEITAQMGYATNNRCNIINVLSNDRMVMTERADTAIINGQYCPHSMVAVYELADDGRISKWREYIDMRDLAARMEGREP